MRNERSISNTAFNLVNYSFFAIVVLCMVIPFLNVVSVSLSNEIEVIKSRYLIFPKGITLEAYKQIFTTSTLFNGILNSVKIVLIGVPCSVFVTSIAAYLLTLKKLVGTTILGHLFIFNMMFGPGLIPLYVLYKRIGIINTHAVLILPFLMVPYFLIYVKNYFHTIPDSIKESAQIDGASEMRILFRIILPLAKPIIAVLVLWYLVDYWNLYVYPTIFLTDEAKRTIQPILKDIVMQTGSGEMNQGSGAKIFGKNVAMGVMVISALPILIVYPYLQKYLIKGIILGGVKE
jgi:putative aldouronate transport system permease protein